MKNTVQPLFVTLLLLFYAQASFAKCLGNALDVWPGPGTTVRQNAVFVLNGTGTSMSVIYGLNTKYPIYLKAGKQKIKLQMKETLTGDFKVAQAILIPATNLQAGLEYELIIDNLPDNERVTMYDRTTGKELKTRWKVIEGLDKTAPLFTQQPQYTSKAKQALGCGPAVRVNFSFTTADTVSNVLVQATVKDMVTGRMLTYYIAPLGNTITIGHGMCAGAFDFVDSRAYEVSFALMDASGNITPEPSKAIAFTAPTFADSGEE